MKRPAIKSVDELLAETTAQLTKAEERCSYLEMRKAAEYNGRLEAERKIGELQHGTHAAAQRSAECLRERDAALRQLAFAQGYIAALKGEPYPLDQIIGETPGITIGPLRIVT